MESWQKERGYFLRSLALSTKHGNSLVVSEITELGLPVLLYTSHFGDKNCRVQSLIIS